jgi:NTE family protein
MGHPRIGLALGSGATRGWSHIGVIQALTEAGINADIVCGSSMGSLVGAAYVTGRLEALEDWVHKLTWREVVSLLDLRLSGGGLVKGTRFSEFLSELYEDVKIESLAKRFVAIATDFDTGREAWLKKGSVTDAVRASVALPGLFMPARNGDRWLMDGGLVNPVPVSACRAFGADVVIAVNLNGDLLRKAPKLVSAGPGEQKSPKDWREPLEGPISDIPSAMKEGTGAFVERFVGAGSDSPGYFDVVFGSIDIMQDHITRSRMAGEPPDIMLAPRSNGIGLLDFNRADEAIGEGRCCVRRMLPALREVVGAPRAVP